jgi:regulator of protease activity HflC (stomatin/prohibitin superfamily)
MTEFFQWIANFFREFKILAIVLPWERALRVRLGKDIVIWESGWHIRLPFIDEINICNTRLRITSAGSQTLTTSDGHTLTINICIGFRIEDPLRAMLKLHHPENSAACLASSVLSEIIATHTRDELKPSIIEKLVMDSLYTEGSYIYEWVRVTDFVYTRAYRLLNDNSYRNGFVTIEERKI